jgi:molecular chaperone GrpE
MNDDAPEAAGADEPDGVEPDEATGATSEGSTTETDREATGNGTDAAGSDATTEAAGGERSDDEPASLADRVAEYDEELAEEVRTLEAQVDEHDEALSELESRLRRTQADFQNYKKRAKRKQEEIRSRATEQFVERVVEVRDNLVRALDQEEGSDIRPGVEATLETFDRILADENVEPIDPAPGEEVDPMRHEVMMRVDSDHPEGTVVDVYRPGYRMADKVVREAQVTVSTGEGDDADADAAATDGGADAGTDDREGDRDDEREAGG